MPKKFKELVDQMSPESQEEVERDSKKMLEEMDAEDRPPEMDFMDEEDPFIEVDGKKELKDGGGMIKESVVEK
jgi:hypothetical protein